MTREMTGYLKGVAILFMVFLHLFKFMDKDVLMFNLVSINEVPLTYYIARMCNPVPFFLILSGYGLYATFTKQGGGGVKPCKRVLYLYIHLWLIYLIFVPIASFVRPEMYPGSVLSFIKNATSWECSYIGEQWFFLPYLVLMAMSKWVFKIFDRIGSWLSLLISAIFYCATVYILKRYGESTLAENMLFYNVFLSFYMLFPFALGYAAKKEAWVEKMGAVFERLHLSNNWIVSLVLIAVCFIRCTIPNASIAPFFAIVFVLVFCQLKIGRFACSTLSYLGKHSMNIWLIHTWICNRLFPDFTYGLYYPIFIFLFVILASVFISHVVELLYSPCSKLVNNIYV